MPVMTADQARQYMAEQQDHKLQCLARWMLRHFYTREQRHAFLDKMKARMIKAGATQQQVDAFAEDLIRRVFDEWQAAKEQEQVSA